MNVLAPTNFKITDGKMRNKPCLCGSGKKYKKCCLNPLQGYVKDGNSWVRPIVQAKKKNPLDVQSQFEMAQTESEVSE